MAKQTSKPTAKAKGKAKPKKLPLPKTMEGGGCPDNKFTYTFERDNASILSLIVGEFEVHNPQDTGEFTTCINDPSPEPKVRVIGLAKEDIAGGRASLTLTFLGKNVFTSPKEFTLAENGFLKLHATPKLP